MHRGRSADRELNHSVLRFALDSKNLVERRGNDRTLFWQWLSAERVFRLRTCGSNLFGGVVDLFNGARKLLSCAFAFNVHEEDFGLIEKEMVMQRCHVKSVVQG